MVELNEPIREILEAANYWHVATLNPDGSPQVTPMCVGIDGDLLVLSTTLDRQKSRNIARDPRVALSWCDPKRPQSNVAIRGRVVRSYTGELADADIEAVSQRYAGRPHQFQEGERRVTYLVEPDRVFYRPPS